MSISKVGLTVSGIFVAFAVYLIVTQGLFGESFIALLLGMPWVLAFVPFEFFGIENQTALTAMLVAPIALNTYVLYWIGALLGRLFGR